MARVDNRDFVVAYATAYNIEDVMKATGMSKAAISARRNFLQNKGVKFPKLNSPLMLTPLDIAQLNSLIIKHDVRKKQHQLA